MRMVGGLPVVVGIGAAAVAVVLTGHSASTPPAPDGTAVPERLAGYSYVTGKVSDAPPGPAVALFQHGWGVEFLDFPQAVVLGAGGDLYRRVDAAEDRAGAASQGDPAPMLLSPDGTKVAVGDHDTQEPDVVVVDLLTGETTAHPLPTGRSVLPVAWTRDGTMLAHLLSPEPTNPYSGERITGEVGVLDLGDHTTEVLPDDDVIAVAFSPDGTELALDRAGSYFADRRTLSVVDLASGDTRALGVRGVLAGPAAWSPDGRLIATTTLEPYGTPSDVPDSGMPTGLAFVDASGQETDVPEGLGLPLAEAGRVLGWTDGDEVLTLLDGTAADSLDGTEVYTLSGVPADGTEPRTLMRIGDLQSYGVGRFQVASALVGDPRIVSPTDVDRGPWPLPLRGALGLLVGLVAWLAARFVVRLRGRVTDPRR